MRPLPSRLQTKVKLSAAEYSLQQSERSARQLQALLDNARKDSEAKALEITELRSCADVDATADRIHYLEGELDTTVHSLRFAQGDYDRLMDDMQKVQEELSDYRMDCQMAAQNFVRVGLHSPLKRAITSSYPPKPSSLMPRSKDP